MSSSNHIAFDLLIRAIDDEVSGSERKGVDEHLANCDECRARQREYGALSVHLESAVARTPVSVPLHARAALSFELLSRESGGRKTLQRSSSVRLRWGVSLAAGLVFAALLLPRLLQRAPVPNEIRQQQSGALNTFELDGETFVSLPYSNPYLPASGSHIVQMEVPISSLADAGLMFEPVSTEASNRSVLADVLLGVDGEPIGVHVIEAAP